MGDMSAAARVGLLVILATVLIVFATQFLRQDAGDGPTTYRVEFADAGGLTRGSKVMLAGVEVGRVRSVGLTEAGSAEAVLDIQRGVELRQGVTAEVPTSLVSIGVSEVRLAQPVGATAAHDPSVAIRGTVSSPLKDIVPDLEPTLKEVNKTLVAVQGLVQDQELKMGLVQTMQEGQKTARAFGQLATRLDGVIAENQATVRASLMTARDALKDLQVMSREMSQLIASGELQGKTTALLDNMNESVKSANKLVTDLNKLANDPELTGSLKATLDNIKIASESAPKISENTAKITENGVTISEETVALMKKANEMATKVDALIEKFNSAVDRIGGSVGGGRSLLPNVDLEIDTTRSVGPARIRTDVTAVIPSGNERIRLGLYDAFELNKLIAQLQRPFGPKADLRYGIYASKPGAGVDFRVAPRTLLQADFFGLNDTRLDAKLRHDFGRGINGYVGFDRIFDRNSFSAGVGIRR